MKSREVMGADGLFRVLKGHRKSLGFYSGKKQKPLEGFWERNERRDLYLTGSLWMAV